MIPKYVKCLKVWAGTGKSVIGKIYCTDEPPDFSIYEWEYILLRSSYKHYFEAIEEVNFYHEIY